MFAGRYYNGRDAQATAVACTADEAGRLRISGPGVERSDPLAQIRTSPRLARIERCLRLPDGAKIYTDDNDAVDALWPQQHRLEAFVERLERRWRAVLASVVVAVGAAILFFSLGLPWLAERVARQMPVALEQSMGERTLAQLRRLVLHTSTLPAKRQAELSARFADFVRDIPQTSGYRVEFCAADFGANAFALPGGIIVFTDQMVGLLDNDDQFLAVAAHEIGHEQHRHLLRSVLQSSAVIVVGAMFAGDVGAASSLVVTVPAFLLQNHYSRTFEADADAYAFVALARHGISPQVFADVMLKLQASHPELKDAGVSYLSTHPPTAERIQRAENAAAAFEKARMPATLPASGH